VPGHDHHPPARFAAIAARWGIGCTRQDGPNAAVRAVAAQAAQAGDDAPRLLIGGSPYLAGEILRLNTQPPE
jgi:dihydrofolate synthase/folylpolyglutamate synthase